MKKEIAYQDKKISYRVVGKGYPVLLIHGFGENGDVWRNQVEYLKDDYRLIIPDLPGSGDSAMINDMSMEGMADCMRAIIVAEEIHSPAGQHNAPAPPSKISKCSIIIGHSMGGYITLAFAEKYPESLTAFGLFHSTAYADSAEKKIVRRNGIAAIKSDGALAFLQTATPNLFAQRTRNERPNLVDEQMVDLQQFTPAALIAYYEAMINRPDRTNILQTTNATVLFIFGERDQVIPLPDGLAQCHLPGKSFLNILRESGHMGMLEEAGKTNDALKGFFEHILALQEIADHT